ncbi:MAG: type II secretion system protein GspJ [Candidatus Omnitrophica bacterium]|nr:type II secretion system protein GspJ [Candidatus Omnitrophota bacterium]
MNRKSFTLIELLITASIIAVIILSVYSAFNTGILAYKKIDSAFSGYQEARVVFNRLESDLRNSFVYSKQSSLFKAGPQELDFLNVSRIYDNDKEYSNLCRIKYELSGTTLKRTAYSGLSALSRDDSIKPQDFSSSIKSVDFEYAYIGNGEKKEILWQNSWPKIENQAKQLPLAVKVNLVIISKEEKQQKLLMFTKIISLPQANTKEEE